MGAAARPAGLGAGLVVADMRMMTDAEERRLTLLEQQVEALLAGRERMSVRIMKLREFIAAHGPHEDDVECQTCRFLM